MTYYRNKSELYDDIQNFRNKFNITSNSYPLNLIDIFGNRKGLKIGSMHFSTHGLRGIAAKGNSLIDDVIILDDSRTSEEKNFYCGHEIMHLLLHRNQAANSFKCYDTVQPNQNSFLEWEANEGSAELLMPCKELIPIINRALPFLKHSCDYRQLKSELSAKYNVSTSVVECRLESLKFEIYQYNQGISLENVKIISNSRQRKNNINIKSLNDIEKEKFDFEYKEHLHRAKCLKKQRESYRKL